MMSGSSRSEEGFALLGLPEACIVRLCLFLSDRDVCMLEVCCKELRRVGQANQIWSPRVADCLGVPAQAPDSVGQSLCGRVHSAPRPAFTRFTGVYADGGVDTISQKYVVDNAFSTTKWLSYCSEKGSNVHCCAVLLDDDNRKTKAMRDHRHFLISHLKLAYALQNFMLGVPLEEVFRLAAKPDNEVADAVRMAAEELRFTDLGYLEVFFVQLVADLHAGGNAGRALLCPNEASLSGFPGGSREAINFKDAQIRDFEQPITEQPERFQVRQRDMQVLELDPVRDFQNLPAEPHCRARICQITLVKSRHFTCPVQSGVLFSIPSIQLPSGQPHMATFQALTQEPQCQAFDGLHSVEAVLKASKEGLVPRVIHGQIHSAGMWLEFEPCRQPGMSSSPSPVLWFRFWAGCELRALQSYHRNYLDHEAEPFEPDLNPHYTALYAQGFMSTLKYIRDTRGPQAAELFPLPTNPFNESDSESERDDDEEHIPDPDKAGVLLPVSRKTVDTLSACLSRPRISNAIVLKLLDQENLMSLMGDHHSAPNIDLHFCGMSGQLLELPPELVLL